MNEEIDEEIGMIGESDARLILEVLKNLKPAYGYKQKHKKAIHAIKATVWGFDWENHQKQCNDFLKELRAMQANKVAL